MKNKYDLVIWLENWPLRSVDDPENYGDEMKPLLDAGKAFIEEYSFNSRSLEFGQGEHLDCIFCRGCADSDTSLITAQLRKMLKRFNLDNNISVLPFELPAGSELFETTAKVMKKEARESRIRAFENRAYELEN